MLLLVISVLKNIRHTVTITPCEMKLITLSKGFIHVQTAARETPPKHSNFPQNFSPFPKQASYTNRSQTKTMKETTLQTLLQKQHNTESTFLFFAEKYIYHSDHLMKNSALLLPLSRDCTSFD